MPLFESASKCCSCFSRLAAKGLAALRQKFIVLHHNVRSGSQFSAARELQAFMATRKEPTVIKKYANRRLYHTGTSAYVTLEDLAGLVRKGEDFVVYDAKSGDDITRSVLAQIIFEEESKEGQNLLPVNVLRQLIGFYGGQMQSVVPRYLEFSMDSFTREQSVFKEHMAKTFGQTAAEMLDSQARANMKIFSDAMMMFNPFGATASPDGSGTDAEKVKVDDPAGDLDALKQQMSEMQARLEKLSRNR
jgi:polyhydroxyalkanoate synthesis repressor PhaR